MKQARRTLAWALFLITALAILANGQTKAAPGPSASVFSIQKEEAYVMRDGLRIYLWEKYRADQEQSFQAQGESRSWFMEARARAAPFTTCRFATTP